MCSPTPTASCSIASRTGTPRSGSAFHRCLGSNLARMELRVALEEWIRRYPDFELTIREVTWSAGQVRGPRTVPVRIL